MTGGTAAVDAAGADALDHRARLQLVHKRHVASLLGSGGPDAACAAYGLTRIDRRPDDLPRDAIVSCMVVRNEAARLDAVLDHHRRLGVERFFVVDNESTDSTRARLLDQPDVRLWAGSVPFRAANYGAAWFEVILRQHALDHWVVLVDADEQLWYPGCESRPLSDLCQELDTGGARALGAAFLDLYAAEPLADVRFPAGSPLGVFRYFDRRWFHTLEQGSGPFRNQVGLFGGVRRRVFGGARWDYCLNKVPLLRYDVDTVLVGGQHATNLRLAPVRGAVLHFKLDHDLARFARAELTRGQRAEHDSEYHAYAEALARQPRLTPFDAAESVRFDGSAQLVELGVMGPVPDLDAWRAEGERLIEDAAHRDTDSPVAIARLERAAVLLPTATTPLVLLARRLRLDGDRDGAARALDEAVARDPDDLPLVEAAELSVGTQLPGPLTDSEALAAGAPVRGVARPATSAGRLDLRSIGPAHRPRWATALDAITALHGDGGVRFDEFVEATFTGSGDATVEVAHLVPWVGCLHGVVDAPDLPVFAHHGLPMLWANPAFARSLEHCLGLFTFTARAAEWIRAHTDVPVSVVTRPVDRTDVRFDLAAFARSTEHELVQTGWWLTRLNSISDLPAPTAGATPARKVRAVVPERRRLVAGLARAQRWRDGWAPDLAAVAATEERTLTPEAHATVLAGGVVYADLYDANGDPTVLRSIASGTPIVVNPVAGAVEHLGADYPLYFDDPGHAAALAADADRIAAAHAHLRRDEIRACVTPEAFLASVRDSDVYTGLA